MTSWHSILTALVQRTDLTAQDAAWAMERVMAGEATSAQIAAFAVGLRAKGETVTELLALSDTMLAHGTPFTRSSGLTGRRVVDIVGTGGDGSNSVNISTMAAIVTAAAGATVIKHGNRAASSQCGSADVLAELGLLLDLPAERVVEVADEVGITFCFAPVWHPAMRHAGPARRELGIPTTFNYLGPIGNPARPEAMALGVADGRMGALIAGVLARRGVDGYVFRSDNGMDELSTTAHATVWSVREGEVAVERLDPADHGFAAASVADLAGSDAAGNAAVVRRVLAGQPGPVRDAVVLNAALALAAVAGTAGGVDAALAAQLPVAGAAIDSGAAAALLDRWIGATK